MKGHHNKYIGRTNMIIQAGVHRLTTPLKGTYEHAMMKSESFSSNLKLLEMITGGFSKLSLQTGNLPIYPNFRINANFKNKVILH